MKKNEIPQKGKSSNFTVIQSLMSLLLALLLGAFIIAVCGYNPISAYKAIALGAFGSPRAVIQTLTQATPLIFSGLAFLFARRATMLNLGIEGQLYFGALAAAAVGLLPVGPAVIHIPLALAAGMAAGGLYAAFVGFLKVRFGSNEVIATIMLNFVATGVVDYFIAYHLQAQGSALTQTERLQESAILPRFIQQYQLSIAIVLAVAIAILIKFIMDKTVFGYELKAVGSNLSAAKTAGIRTGRVMVLAMLVSGAIAGAAGACHVMGVDRRLVSGFSPGYGFDGIAVAALAGNSPVAVVFSGVLFGALRAGAIELNLSAKVPTDFVYVIQALVVVLVSAPYFVQKLRGLFRKKGGAVA